VVRVDKSKEECLENKKRRKYPKPGGGEKRKAENLLMENNHGWSKHVLACIREGVVQKAQKKKKRVSQGIGYRKAGGQMTHKARTDYR